MRNQRSINHARNLRTTMTDAERRIWRHLRMRQLAGLRFRRQVTIGKFIVDFACIEAWCVVEIDGSQHADSERDRERDAWLESEGWRVLRFWNNDVLLRTEAVLEAMYRVLVPPSCPSPASQGKERVIKLRQ